MNNKVLRRACCPATRTSQRPARCKAVRAPSYASALRGNPLSTFINRSSSTARSHRPPSAHAQIAPS